MFSRFSSIEEWTYLSSVICGLAWPSTSERLFISNPALYASCGKAVPERMKMHAVKPARRSVIPQPVLKRARLHEFSRRSGQNIRAGVCNGKTAAESKRGISERNHAEGRKALRVGDDDFCSAVTLQPLHGSRQRGLSVVKEDVSPSQRAYLADPHSGKQGEQGSESGKIGIGQKIFGKSLLFLP